MALISIIVPIYNEEGNLPVFYERLKNVTDKSGHTFEFIFVDDGSSDNSFSILKNLQGSDARVKVIQFSRNFGSHAGCLAGLIYSKGDAVTFLSADLQDPPELIPELAEKWISGYEVVIGIRKWEKHIGRFFPSVYYSLVRKFALKNMPQMGTDLFLIDRKVVNAIKNISEKNTSVFGLILWSGFHQALVHYEKGIRYKGASKWTFGKKIKLFIDTFVSFSYFPIRLISGLGIVLAALGFLYAAIVIINKLFFSKAVEGWASIMVVLLVVSGIQLLMLGILGEYLWRNFDESRKRPIFIIDKTIGFHDNEI